MLKSFVILIILLALLGGLLTVFLRPDQIINIVRFKDFLDFAITILAFGALIKYLCTFKS